MVKRWVLVALIVSSAVPTACKSSSGGRGSSGARFSGPHVSSSGRSSSVTPRTSTSSRGSTGYTSSFRTTVFHSSYSSSYFSSGIGGTHVIIVPSSPLVYSSHSYYWGHAYYPHPVHLPLTCEYTIQSDDDELRNVTFSNGTHPENVIFGCPANSECCGLDCCSDTSVVAVIICILLAASVLACTIAKCIRNYKLRRNAQVITHTVPVPISMCGPAVMPPQIPGAGVHFYSNTPATSVYHLQFR